VRTKVSEATGPVLDWMVDLALGGYNPGTMYSSYWAVGGPIIEREGITLQNTDDVGWMHMGPDHKWAASMPGCMYTGPTPLIAAMRCFVASKLGDEVDVPKELT
jgi:Protein of unknown function (DUF2591)